MRAKSSPLFAQFKPELVLGFAASVSLILILLPKDLLTYSYELDPSESSAQLLSDSFSGGNSTVEWIEQGKLHWRCSIGSARINPYCSMHLPLERSQGRGLDLSRFEKMKIWMIYKGDAKHVRLYLRNRSLNTFVTGNDLSTKYNVVEIPTSELEKGLEVNMSDFTVAQWWIVQRNVSLKDAKPEFNDVAALEVQTGSAVSSGVHEIQLVRITWQGSLISELALYRGITITWTTLIIAFLAFRLVRMRLELKKQRSYQEELLTINNLLSLQNRQFEDLAKTDQLTGLLNRIGIRDVLYQGLVQWKRNETPFSVVLIDIDHFKRINDTYGHNVGDEILKGAAEIFKSHVRKSDFLARWGGEEFILLCPNTNRVQAMAAAESLRKRLEAETLYQDIKITASFGVSTMSQPDLDHLFKSADEALYRAKNRGRNCVMSDVMLSA